MPPNHPKGKLFTRKRRQKKNLDVIRKEANFDRACDMAFKMAQDFFQVDEDGYLNVEDYVRSQDTLHVEFVRYERMWQEHHYHFRTWVSNGHEEYGDDLD